MSDKRDYEERAFEFLAETISQAHNAMSTSQVFYARSLAAAGLAIERQVRRAEAAELHVRGLGSELQSLRGKVAALEVERDDLRSELCRLRSEQGRAIVVDVADASVAEVSADEVGHGG